MLTRQILWAHRIFENSVFLQNFSTYRNFEKSVLKQEIDSEWEFLFNGKTLDNWKTFNGGAVTGWKIIDGELHNSGVGSDHGGDIITDKQSANITKNFRFTIFESHEETLNSIKDYYKYGGSLYWNPDVNNTIHIDVFEATEN